MGNKGDKQTQQSAITVKLILGRLQPIDGITSKKMFGGYGIFHEAKMFGMVDSKGGSFFKVNESNQVDYIEKGAKKHGRMPYFAIPEEVLENPELLIAWAEKSIAISK